jgi:hypothetical protein
MVPVLVHPGHIVFLKGIVMFGICLKKIFKKNNFLG